MSLPQEHESWLEHAGQEYILEGNCSFGRAALNTLVLESPKVSRLHAIIHMEKAAAFWLVDLGSSNGTFLNKRRIHEPAQLHDRDQIAIGGKMFTFRQSHPSSRKTTGPLITLREKIADLPCWLLVTDIINFTPLTRELVSAKLALLVSRWVVTCKEIIEGHEGVMNKYLGDGILAYWRDDDRAVEQIIATIAALKRAQRSRPHFRFVIHLGSVAIGSVSATREETLMGGEVNLVFRLEKLAAVLGESCGISDTAHAKLKEHVPAHCLGDFELKGFERKRSFFRI